MNTRTVLLVALLSIGLFTNKAHADGEYPGFFTPVLGLLALDSMALSGGIVTAIASGVTLRRDQPKRGWFVADCVVGGLNLAIGAAIATIGVAVHDTSYVFWVIAGPSLGVGAIDLTLGIYGLKHREAPKLSFVPLFGRDSANRPFAGASVNLVTF